ncbi:MAG TPA: CBS domain-containing protein [Streptosporangiaceae bacterium]|jgi:CBS domain-containing protein
MAEASEQEPSVPTSATVADVMRPPVTTVGQYDHAAAAAYLMKHAGVSALVVLDSQTDQPIGIVTEADIAHVVADGRDVNDVRIHDMMTESPTVIHPKTSIIEAAKIMTNGRFRHLPVVDDDGIAGMVDITDVCRALLDIDLSGLAATSTAEPE